MRVVSRNLTLLVAAAALAAATSTVATPAPASAATCSSTHGVSIVVDFHELGGGVRTACVADGGGRLASDLFPAAGFSLDYVQRQPGFVCRVSGVPASDPCVNTPAADAYWGLWWSDGKTGSWSYASSGAASLRVPEGGYAAFSWNGSSARSTPGASPAPHPTATPTVSSPTTSSTPHPSQHPSSHHSATSTPSPAGASSSESASASGSPDPTDMETATPSKRHHHTPSATPSSDPTSSPSASPDQVSPMAADATDPADPDDSGLPAWVAPIVIVVLFGAVGGVLVVRRRRASP